MFIHHIYKMLNSKKSQLFLTFTRFHLLLCARVITLYIQEDFQVRNR